VETKRHRHEHQRCIDKKTCHIDEYPYDDRIDFDHQQTQGKKQLDKSHTRDDHGHIRQIKKYVRAGIAPTQLYRKKKGIPADEEKILPERDEIQPKDQHAKDNPRERSVNKPQKKTQQERANDQQKYDLNIPAVIPHCFSDDIAKKNALLFLTQTDQHDLADPEKQHDQRCDERPQPQEYHDQR